MPTIDFDGRTFDLDRLLVSLFGPEGFEPGDFDDPDDRIYTPGCVCKLCQAERTPMAGVIDHAEVERLRRHLGVTRPVHVEVCERWPEYSKKECAGTHVLDDGVHRIRIHPSLDVEQANATLCHEMAHAAQYNGLVTNADVLHHNQQVAHDMRVNGYEDSWVERDANARAATLKDQFKVVIR